MPSRSINSYRGRCGVVGKLFTLHGSVFPQALPVALPNALITATLVVLVHGWGSVGKLDAFHWLRDEDSVLKENTAFSGFSFLIGFLVIFRTSQSYARFWEGCSALNKMHAEWFDSVSSLIAFTRGSKAPEENINAFRGVLIRLFSLLNAMALADVEDCCGNGADAIKAFQLPLLDVGGLDRDSLETLFKCDSRTELVVSWIQQSAVDGIHSGILSAPPPVVSRLFQELANGMVEFHNAMKISWIPFPFPYAQACDFLLVLHWLLLPFVICRWVPSPVSAFVFTFVQVFILWALAFTATELENPFGGDANDINFLPMQIEFNYQLLLLVHPGTLRLPTLREDAEAFHESDYVSVEQANQLGAGVMAKFENKRQMSKSLYAVLTDRDSEIDSEMIARRSTRCTVRNDEYVAIKSKVSRSDRSVHGASNFQKKKSRSSLLNRQISTVSLASVAEDESEREPFDSANPEKNDALGHFVSGCPPTRKVKFSSDDAPPKSVAFHSDEAPSIRQREVEPVVSAPVAAFSSASESMPKLGADLRETSAAADLAAFPSPIMDSQVEPPNVLRCPEMSLSATQ